MQWTAVSFPAPPGSGKTTLEAALATRIPNAVHLETDSFYAAIKADYVAPWLEAAEQQNRTVVRAAAEAAAEYARGGYFVVLDGVVLPWAPEVNDATMRAAGFELALLVLLPNAEETNRRGMGREPDHGLTPEVYAEMHRQFEAANFHPGEVLDSTMLSIDEVVAAARQRVGPE